MREVMLATTKELQSYAGYCPGCGHRLKFDPPLRDETVEAVCGQCFHCKKKWSMIFDLDQSGTFGVMSFQCDNEDRIM